MELTPRDIFIDYLINDPIDKESYFNDVISFIHGEAQRKGHEFDDYFETKWKESADTISQFNEYYFNDLNRQKLYVYLSAMIDDEIFGYLNDAQEVAGSKLFTKEFLKDQIDFLINIGTKF